MNTLIKVEQPTVCTECGDELHDHFEIEFEVCWICEQFEIDEYYYLMQTYYNF